MIIVLFFFSSRRRHTRFDCDWSSDVCSSDLRFLHTWDQTKEKASRALDRTEGFLRENPVPTVLGALGLGIAIGLAIRYAAPSERKHEIVLESPLGKFNWSVLSLPFLWPLFKSAREKSEDVMRNGVKQLKKMDVERYAKPIRKRWRAWTR